MNLITRRSALCGLAAIPAAGLPGRARALPEAPDIGAAAERALAGSAVGENTELIRLGADLDAAIAAMDAAESELQAAIERAMLQAPPLPEQLVVQPRASRVGATLQTMNYGAEPEKDVAGRHVEQASGRRRSIRTVAGLEDTAEAWQHFKAGTLCRDYIDHHLPIAREYEAECQAVRVRSGFDLADEARTHCGIAVHKLSMCILAEPSSTIEGVFIKARALIARGRCLPGYNYLDEGGRQVASALLELGRPREAVSVPVT